MRARHSVNEGFGQELHMKNNNVNSLKRFQPFSESPDTET